MGIFLSKEENDTPVSKRECKKMVQSEPATEYHVNKILKELKKTRKEMKEMKKRLDRLESTKHYME